MARSGLLDVSLLLAVSSYPGCVGRGTRLDLPLSLLASHPENIHSKDGRYREGKRLRRWQVVALLVAARDATVFDQK